MRSGFESCVTAAGSGVDYGVGRSLAYAFPRRAISRHSTTQHTGYTNMSFLSSNHPSRDRCGQWCGHLIDTGVDLKGMDGIASETFKTNQPTKEALYNKYNTIT